MQTQKLVPGEQGGLALGQNDSVFILVALSLFLAIPGGLPFQFLMQFHISCLLLPFFLKTQFFCVVLAVPGLALQTRLASNLETRLPLSPKSQYYKGICHHHPSSVCLLWLYAKSPKGNSYVSLSYSYDFFHIHNWACWQFIELMFLSGDTAQKSYFFNSSHGTIGSSCRHHKWRSTVSQGLDNLTYLCAIAWLEFGFLSCCPNICQAATLQLTLPFTDGRFCHSWQHVPILFNQND